MQLELKDYWKSYYAKLADTGEVWLDYSNPRVQLQSLALCVEAAGDILGRSCADLGCGRGQLAQMLAALGGSPVMGVDFVDSLIEGNRQSFPQLDWRCGDILNTSFLRTLPKFDRIFMIEMLQYVDMAATIPIVWQLIRPGGRLVCMVPNEECPIIRTVTQRFGKRYLAVNSRTLVDLADCLNGLAFWSCRGLTFQSDQRVVPYCVGDWSTQTNYERAPNRLNVVFVKAD